MNNPFEGKAIKFETEQELNHLAELARGYGLSVVNFNFNRLSNRFFRESQHQPIYSNYSARTGYTEITYSDFIASLPIEIDYMKEVCNRCKDAVLCVVQNGYYVNLNGKYTPTFPNINDAWKSAYHMLPPTSSHTEQQPDIIARPEHYRKCSIEPIQIWRELSLNGFMGDALKYLMRLGHKDSKAKELTKCIQYLTWEIGNVELGIMQFTPKDAKCSVDADVIAKELGMSPFIHVALWVVLNLHTVEDKVNALNTAINSIRFEIDKTEKI